jgi:hypothetical protein
MVTAALDWCRVTMSLQKLKFYNFCFVLPVNSSSDPSEDEEDALSEEAM